MKDWHVENMKKTVLKYLSGPSENKTFRVYVKEYATI